MNKTPYLLIILILIIVLAGCTSAIPVDLPFDPDVESTLPGPQVHITAAPDATDAVQNFMTLWQDEDYAAMYGLLTAETKGQISEADFIDRYRETAIALTMLFNNGVDYQLVSSTTSPNSAQVKLRVNYNTHLFDTISREIDLDMVREAGQWRLQWHEGVIFPELDGGNFLETVRQITPRGNIYASDGSPIVSQEEAVALGFIPANLNRDLLSLFYNTMARLTAYEVEEIVELVERSLPNDYIPLGEASRAEVDANMGAITSLSGVFLNYYSSRFYHDGGIAPQAIGHLTYISEEEGDRFLRMGYSLSERFGSTGMESAFEDVLSGQRGATLYLKDADGQIIDRIAETPSSPGQSITTTIDPDLQLLLQRSLGSFRGAIVVMEMDTGRILAMVSNPGFDPNIFDISNQNFFYSQNPYLQPNDPVFNRATNGQYPLGSVFKIVSMAAALDTGVFDATSEIYCGHSIEVCGNELFDWTFEKEFPPSGDLTLPGGLMRSCNPWFFYIGEQLLLEGYPNAIADMARSFGMGEPTGIEISEQPGNIPAVVGSCETNTQLAIGQGEMTGTPLQTAMMVAAIGNGGTLYRPTIIDSIGPEGGVPTYSFSPEINGRLPISEEQRLVIENAMREVIANRRGTAQIQLGTLQYRSYGKTGTAENPFGRSHAWFAGYTRVGNPDRPDIAVAVILENAGEGSEMAAPVFRRAVSLYFSNYANPGWLMEWEARPYVIASPTPIPSDTPIPTNTPVPTETPFGWDGEEPIDEDPEQPPQE